MADSPSNEAPPPAPESLQTAEQSGRSDDRERSQGASSPTEGATNARTTVSSLKTRVWALPWVITIVAMYAFALPWINFAIVMRYFVKPNFEAALPGLGTTLWRKVTMRGHMSTGAICLLLGPLQFIPKMRKSFPRIHRWSGRIYCTCAMASCLFGLAFIGSKGKLVGGWNMTVAFSLAGIAIGVLGFKAWQSARAAKAGGSNIDFTAHRNWGIRSYSQILAPMLYRYWYICVQLFGMYEAPKPQQLGGYCTRDGLCPDYLRLFDKTHCWTYWLTALAVAELIIYYLPKHHIESPARNLGLRSETETLLVSRTTDGPATLASTRVTDQASPTHSSPEEEFPGPLRPIHTASPLAVNIIGWILAVIAVAITSRLYTSAGM